MGKAHQCPHSCLGVRSVADLERVDAKVQVRPVQQAKLAWALWAYQQQLRQEKQGQAAAQRAAQAARAEFRRQETPRKALQHSK